MNNTLKSVVRLVNPPTTIATSKVKAGSLARALGFKLTLKPCSR